MEYKNLNSGLVVALQMLGYEDINEISELPKLEDVRKAFFNSARRTHPDKNSKSDNKTKEKLEESFKKLLNAYKLVSEFIILNEKGDTESDGEGYDSDTKDQGDEELSFQEKEFREVNIVSQTLTLYQ